MLGQMGQADPGQGQWGRLGTARATTDSDAELRQNVIPASLADLALPCGCQELVGPMQSAVLSIGGASLQSNIQPTQTLSGASSELLLRATSSFTTSTADLLEHSKSDSQVARPMSTGLALLSAPSFVQVESELRREGSAKLHSSFSVSLPALERDPSLEVQRAPQSRLKTGKLLRSFTASKALFSQGLARKGKGGEGSSPASPPSEGLEALDLKPKSPKLTSKWRPRASSGGLLTSSSPEGSRKARPRSGLDGRQGEVSVVLPSREAIPVTFSLTPSDGALGIFDGGVPRAISENSPTDGGRIPSAVELSGTPKPTSPRGLKPFRKVWKNPSSSGVAPASAGSGEERGPKGPLLGREWAEAFAGEDRAQVILAPDGTHTFVGVYDGFMDCAAVDLLMSHMYPLVTDELNRLALPAALPCQHTADVDPVHGEILGALEKAYQCAEGLFLDLVHSMSDEQPQLAVAGACVVLVLIVGVHMYVLNIGDSCAVLLQERRDSSTDADADSANAALDRSANATSAVAENRAAQAAAMEALPAVVERANDMSAGADVTTAVPGASSRQEPRAGVEDKGSIGPETEGHGQNGAALAEPFTSPWDIKGSFRNSTKAEAPVDEPGDVQGTQWDVEKLTVDHNTSNKEEMERLMKQRSDDPHAIEKDRVKGKLRVTRAFGGAFMKEADLNKNLFSCFKIKYVGTAPYIGSEPYKGHRSLTGVKGYLVISSDGLYQHMKPEDLSTLLDGLRPGTPRECQALAKRMLDESLNRAAAKARLKLEDVLDMAAGESRRKIHDDISIVVLRIGA